MASGNIERQMEFILEQQAQGAARIGQIEDIIVRFAQATRDRFAATDQRVDDVDVKIAALVDSQIRADVRGKKIDVKMAALVDSQKRTEESIKNTDENIKKTDGVLRKLITTVDRHLSEGRNGNSKKS